MNNSKSNSRLSVKTKIFYGIGDIGNALTNSSIQFFLLKFYTDAILIAPALAANALLIGKLWDSVNDPLFGFISDKVKSPLGKRRALMIYGAVPLGLSIALIWFIPQHLSNPLTFLWIAVSFILWDTLWTMTNVPYYALTAELTDNYDERANLTAYRMLFAVPAFIIGAALTPIIVCQFATQRKGYAIMGILYGVIATLSLLICAWQIKEKNSKIDNENSKGETISSLFLVFKNRPFVQLIISYGIINLAFALTKTLFAYIVSYQFKMEKQVPLVMFLMLASVAIFLFPWKYLSQKFDKGKAYAIGLVVGAGAILATFLMPAKPTFLIYIIAIVAGIGFSANWVFPWAMVPDVVDYDYAESGIYRSGVYYGIWGFAYKLSEGLGIALSGWILQLFGYIPNAVQTEHALLGIRLFVGPVPAILFLISLPLLIWYPINRKKHEQILNKISQKNQEHQISEPILS